MTDVLIVVDSAFSSEEIAKSVMGKFLVRKDTVVYSPDGTNDFVGRYCKDNGVMYTTYTSTNSSELLENISYAIIFFSNSSDQSFFVSAANRIRDIGCVAVMVGV